MPAVLNSVPGRLILVLPLSATILCSSCAPKPTAPPFIGVAVLAADKNPDGKGPALQLRVDENRGDRVQRFPIEPGTEAAVGPGFASVSGEIQCEGSLQFADDGAISGRIVIKASREFLITVVSDIAGARVMRGNQQVEGTTNPLPAGEYVVEFGGGKPDSEPRTDAGPRTTSQQTPP
jgi:hypothetical protein